MRLTIPDLMPGQQYAIQVRAANEDTQSEWSQRFLVTTEEDPGTPKVPANVTWVGVGNAFVGEWSPVTQNVANQTLKNEIAKYDIRLVANGVTKYTSVTPQDVDNNVKIHYELSYEQNKAFFGNAESTVEFSVRAVKKNGKVSAWSTPISAGTGIPGVPQNVVATPITDGVKITWDAPASDFGVVGYNVYVGNDTGFATSPSNLVFSGDAKTATYYTSTYSTHYFKVRAFNQWKQEGPAAVSNGATPISPFTWDSVSPNAPASATVTTGYDAARKEAYIDVNWVASTSNDIGSYTVQYGQSASGPWLNAVVDKDKTTTRLYVTAGQPYHVGVRTVDRYSNVSAFTAATPAPTTAGKDSIAPAAVTGLTSTLREGDFIFNWTAVTTNSDASAINDLAGYEVSITDGTTEKIYKTTDVLFNFTLAMNIGHFGAPGKPQVTAKVRAYDQGGNVGAWSSTHSPGYPLPSNVGALTPALGANSITVSWPAVTNVAIKGYNVYQGTAASPTTKVWFGNSTSYTVIVPNTTPQFFAVKAVDLFDRESATASTNATGYVATDPFAVDTTPPDPVTSLAATITNNESGVGARSVVTWANPAGANNADKVGIEVSYKEPADALWNSMVVAKDSTQATVTLPKAYTAYDFRVRAVDDSGNYATPVTISKAAVGGGTPGTPANPGGTAGKDFITWKWDSVTGADITNYEVVMGTDAAITQNVMTFNAGVALTLNVGGLNQNATYYMKVRAQNRSGNWGSYSTVVNRTTGIYDFPTNAEFDTAVKTYVVEYSVNASETVAPTTGWSTATPTRTPGSFIWYRTLVTYQNDQTSTSSAALLTGNTGAQGNVGPAAPIITLSATAQALLQASTGTGATNPTQSQITATTTGTTVPDATSLTAGWSYAVDGGAFSTTVPAGVGRVGGTVTITGASMTNRTIAVKASNAGVSDIITVSRLYNGADGTSVSITSTSVTYAKNTSGTGAPAAGDFVASPIPVTTTGEFLWTRTIVNYSNGSSTTSYSVAAHGTAGNHGRGITGSTIEYAKNTSATGEPTTGWQPTPPATTTGEFLWTRTTTTFNQAPLNVISYSVAAHGAPGVTPVTVNVGNDAIAIPVTVAGAATANGSTTVPFSAFQGTTRIAATIAATNVPAGITIGTNTPATSSADGSLVISWASGATIGAADLSNLTLTVTAASQAHPHTFSIARAYAGSAGGNGTSPTTLDATPDVFLVPTDTAGNAAATGSAVVTLKGFIGSTASTVSFGTAPTLPAGITATPSAPGTTATLTFNWTSGAQIGGAATSGTFTWPVIVNGVTFNAIIGWARAQQGAPGNDAYTILLTNEAMTFPGSTTASLAGTETTNITAYKGATQQSITAIGTIVSNVSGVSAAVTSGVPGTNPLITVTMNAGVTAQTGTITVPITVDGKVFNKVISWSVSRQGTAGKGISSTTITYVKDSQGTTAPAAGAAWTPTIPTTVAGEYLWTKTVLNYTDQTSDSSYSVSRHGATGGTGNGITGTVVKYMKDTQGITPPAVGNAAWGNTIPAVLEGEFLWTWTRTSYTSGSPTDAYSVAGFGTNGEDGGDGIGISGTTVEYAKSTDGVNAPASGWAIGTIPSTVAGEYLWTRTTTTYTSGSPTIAHSVARHGATGDTGRGISSTVVEYNKSTDGVNAPGTGWTPGIPTTVAGEYLWTRTRITYTTGTPATSDIFSVARHGANGADATDIYITATSQVLSVVPGQAATTPANTTLTASTVGTTFSSWTFSVDGGTFGAAPAGVVPSGNTVVVTGQTFTGKTLTARAAAASGVTDTFTVVKLSNAVSVTGTTVTYGKSTSATSATGITFGSTVPTTVPGEYLWTRTVTNFSDGTNNSATPAYSIAAHGTTGTGITGSVVEYVKNTNGGTIPTTGWSQTFPGATVTGEFLWTRTTTTYSSGSPSVAVSVAAHGSTGTDGRGITTTVVEYVKNTNGSTIPTTGWSQTFPGATVAGEFLWTRTTISYTSGSPSVAVSVAAHGATGDQGTAGRGIQSTATSYQVTSSGTSIPGTTGWVANPPATNPGQFLWTKTTTTYTSGSPATTDAYSVAAHGNTGDPGADGYTIVLSNESQTFAGTTTTAVADTTKNTTVVAYKGTVQQAATVGTITLVGGGALPAGFSATVRAGTNGTTAPIVDFAVTTAMTSASGMVNIPVTVGSTTFNKVFSYAISFKGTDGTTPSPLTTADMGNDAVAIPTSTAGAALAQGSVTIPFTGWIGTTRAAAALTYSALPAGFTLGSNTAGTASAGGSLVLNYANAATIGTGNLTEFPVTITVNGQAFSRTFSIARAVQGAGGGIGPGGTSINVTPDTLVIPTNNAGAATVAGPAVVAVRGTVGNTASNVTALTITSGTPANVTPTITTGAAAQISFAWTNGATIGTSDGGTIVCSATVNGLTFPVNIMWSRAKQGTDGGQGGPGISVTAVTPYFAQVADGATPADPTGVTPAAPWQTLEPAYARNTDLWRADKITYSSGSPTWTPKTKVSSYDALNEAVDNPPGGVNQITRSRSLNDGYQLGATTTRANVNTAGPYLAADGTNTYPNVSAIRLTMAAGGGWRIPYVIKRPGWHTLSFWYKRAGATDAVFQTDVQDIVLGNLTATATWKKAVIPVVANTPDGTYHFADIADASGAGIDIFIFQPQVETGIGASAYTPSVIEQAEDLTTAAQNSANGVNRIYYSTGDASGTVDGNGRTYITGDTWWKKDNATGRMTAQWEYITGTGWSPKTIENSLIANLDVGKLTANNAWIIDATIGSAAQSGSIKSYNYNTTNKTGWKIDNTGIDIQSGTIVADAVRSGNLGGPAGVNSVINVVANTSIIMNGGFLKSNTYTGTTQATNPSGAGFYLGNDGLRIDTGQVKADAFVGGTFTAGTINIGAGGMIKGGSWELSSAGLSIPNGGIKAASLDITIGGGNMVTNSSFEADANADGIPDSFTAYSGGTVNGAVRTTPTDAVAGGGKVLRLQATGFATTGTNRFGINQSISPNITPSTIYTASVYVKGSLPAGSIGYLYVDFADGAGWMGAISRSFNSTEINATTYTRITGTVSNLPRPASQGTAYLWIEGNAATAAVDIYFDNVQVEVGNVPTAYAPRNELLSTTTIDGGWVKTGAIQSTNYNSTNRTGWIINTTGAATFTAMTVWGDSIVGSSANESTSLLRSNNWTGTGSTVGWAIRGDGTAYLQNATVKGAITATSGSFTGDVTITNPGRLLINGSTGAHIELTHNRLRVYNTGGTEVTYIDGTTGAMVTDSLTLGSASGVVVNSAGISKSGVFSLGSGGLALTNASITMTGGGSITGTGWSIGPTGLNIGSSSGTTIDGSVIKTGAIRSTQLAINPATGATIAGEYAWQINLTGDAVFGNAQVRGRLTVGTATGSITSAIQSGNYFPGTSTVNYDDAAGWVIRSSGDAEFNNVTMRNATVYGIVSTGTPKTASFAGEFPRAELHDYTRQATPGAWYTSEAGLSLYTTSTHTSNKPHTITAYDNYLRLQSCDTGSWYSYSGIDLVTGNPLQGTTGWINMRAAKTYFLGDIEMQGGNYAIREINTLHSRGTSISISGGGLNLNGNAISNVDAIGAAGAAVSFSANINTGGNNLNLGGGQVQNCVRIGAGTSSTIDFDITNGSIILSGGANIRARFGQATGAQVVWQGGSIVIGTAGYNASGGAGSGNTAEIYAYRYNGYVAYSNLSDKRVKTNLRVMDGEGIKLMKQLTPRRYNRTDLPSHDKKSHNEHIGFISQEVQKVIPEAVIELHDGMLSLEYSTVFMVGMQAVKELIDRNEALEARVEELEKENSLDLIKEMKKMADRLAKLEAKAK